MDGSDRDAGCDCSSGMSKRESVAMLPEERREIAMLAVLMDRVVVVVAILFSWDAEGLEQMDLK